MGIVKCALKNLSRRKMRALMIIAALSISIAIMVSIPAGIVANQAITSNLFDKYEDEISDLEEDVASKSAMLECRYQPRTGLYLTNQDIDYIRSIEGVNESIPMFEYMEVDNSTLPVKMLFKLYGITLELPFQLPADILKGRTLKNGDQGVVLISSLLMDTLDTHYGAKVSILGEEFAVIGVFQPQNKYDNRMFMNISDVQKVTDNEGRVSRIDVYANNAASLPDVKGAIVEEYPDLFVYGPDHRTKALEDYKERFAGSADEKRAALEASEVMAYLEIGILLVSSSLVILLIMFYSVRERIKEVGVLKAVGFSNWNVLNQFWLESLSIVLLASTLGLLVGSVTGPALSSVMVPSIDPNLEPVAPSGGGNSFLYDPYTTEMVSSTMDPSTMVFIFLLAIVFGSIGSCFPAWKASRISPMEALRDE